jgi:hypothetical protein
MSLENRKRNFRNRSASLNSRSRSRSKSGGGRSRKNKSRQIMNALENHRSSNGKSNYMTEAASAVDLNSIYQDILSSEHK